MINKKNHNLFVGTAKAAFNAADISNWIGTGPSIRARARLVLAVAFIITAPALLIGVMRSSVASEKSHQLKVYEHLLMDISAFQQICESLRGKLWRYEAQPEIEYERVIQNELDKLRGLLDTLPLETSPDLQNDVSQMKEMSQRIKTAVEYVLGLKSAHLESSEQIVMARAQLILVALSEKADELAAEIAKKSEQRRQESLQSISHMGRDQLILFLILLFAFPFFITLAPNWLAAPLVRLKQVRQHIETSRIRDLHIAGNDEISKLAQILQDALMWKEELENKKTAKIFEVRNVLRAVISLVKEPILIVGKNSKINYANQHAAELFSMESHHIEGNLLEDFVFAPTLLHNIERVFDGEDFPKGFTEEIAFENDRVFPVTTFLSGVRDRGGEVSRVVIVFFRGNSDGTNT